MAQASIALKRGTQQSAKPTQPQQTQPTGKDPRIAKANQEAADSRRKARELMQTTAQYEARIKELEDAVSESNNRLTELEPRAKRWDAYAHREKEHLVAKFPKEEQARVRKMDVDDLKFLAQRVGLSGTATQTQTTTQQASAKIATLDDAAKLAETDPKAYNKFMDDVLAGTIKVDAGGVVVG